MNTMCCLQASLAHIVLPPGLVSSFMLSGQTTCRSGTISRNGASILFFNNAGYQAFLSTDGGASFTQVTSFPAGKLPIQIAMSNSGQYIISGYSSYAYVSTNSGSTWVLVSAMTGSVSVSSVCMSSDGQYCGVCGTNGVWMNNNYLNGANWVCTNTSTAIRAGSMSASGQYVLVNLNGASAQLSSNYGVSFAATGSNVGTAGRGCVVSGTGAFMVTMGVSASLVQYSADHGSTWTSAAASVSTNSALNQWLVNGNGSKCVYRANDGTVSVSTDTLQSQSPYNSIGSMSGAILAASDDGKYMVYWSSANRFVLVTDMSI